MTHEVVLTEDASRDLAEIVEYIAVRDSPVQAEYARDRIEAVLRGLTSFPELTLANCSPSASASTGRSSSSPIGWFTGQWASGSTCP